MRYEPLTDEQREIRDVVRTLARERIAPRAEEIDKTAEFPWDMVELFREYDLFGLPFEEDYGGTGTGALMVLVAIEEISKVCATTGLILAVQELGSLGLKLAGDDEQKGRYLPKLASGEWLCAYALTEPGSGSDSAAMRTTAEREGDEYVLDGSKRFITNAGVADLYTVFAKTDPEAGHSGISAFLVEASAPGFEVGRIEPKMGIKGSTTGEIFFNDCRVPADNLLGEEGEGFRIAMRILDRSRPGIGAQGLGLAQGATDYALEYARTRETMGKPIAQHQLVAAMLADMETKCEAARGLLYKCGLMIDEGAPADEITKISAMAKLYCTDAAMEVTTDAVQVLGGYGYMREYPVERMMRDAKITQIYEGTNQIQRLVIARQMLKEKPGFPACGRCLASSGSASGTSPRRITGSGLRIRASFSTRRRRRSTSIEVARVLDLAAGTGRLTQELARRFAHVIAVEPNDAMRELIADGQVLAGRAEAIPLEAASVDAVFVGEAFHWFDVVARDQRDCARPSPSRWPRSGLDALVGDRATAPGHGARVASRAVGAIRVAAQRAVGRRVRRLALRSVALRALRGVDHGRCRPPAGDVFHDELARGARA